MKTIIILLFISSVIISGIVYWISSKEITSEDINFQYRYFPPEINKKVQEDWIAKEKELEKQTEEFCKENPKLCKG